MRRRLLVILSLLALVLAAASPALAQGKAVGKPEHAGQPEQVQTQEQTQDRDQLREQARDREQLQRQDSRPDPLGLQGKAFQGVVTAKGESTLTVHSDKYNAAGKNFIVTVDSQTKIKVPGLKKMAELKDIAVGDRVVVQLQNKPEGAVEGDLGDARAIHVVPGQNFIHVTGELVSASSSEVKIKNGAGQETTYAIVSGSDPLVRDGKLLQRLSQHGVSNLAGEAGRKVTLVVRTSGDPDAVLAIVLHGNVDKDQQQASNTQQGQSNGGSDDQDNGNGQGKGKGQNKGDDD